MSDFSPLIRRPEGEKSDTCLQTEEAYFFPRTTTVERETADCTMSVPA